MNNDGTRPTRDELKAFLATAPDNLKDWARQQLAQVDGASDLAGADGPTVGMPDGSDAGSASEEAVPDEVPTGAPDGEAGLHEETDPDPAEDIELFDPFPDDPEDEGAADVEDLLEEDEVVRDGVRRPGAARSHRFGLGRLRRRRSGEGDDATAGSDDATAEAATTAPEAASTAARGESRLQRRTGLTGLNLVLVTLLAACVVIIIQQHGRGGEGLTASGMPSNHPVVQTTDAATALPTDFASMDEAVPVDADREAELKKAAEADPSDLESRQELGVMYLQAALYQDSITYLQQILDQDPDNADALLTIGVAEYQSNQYDLAETHWKSVTELLPDVAEPWYNLGFLYMAQEPPKVAQAMQAWAKVIELAPSSEMAETARSHQARVLGETGTDDAHSSSAATPAAGPSTGGKG